MFRNLKRIFSIAFLLILSTHLFSQKGIEDGSKFGHGEDSIRCLKNMSLFSEYVKQKNYSDALPAWEITYNECPRAGVKIYTAGVKIMEWLYKKEKNKAKKEEYFKKLMGVFDARIKYYSDYKSYNEDYILGLKSLTLLKYKSNDVASMKDAQKWLKKSIDGKKSASSLTVVIAYMQNTVGLYKKNEISSDEVVNNYIKLTELLDKKIAKARKPKGKDQAKDVKSGIEKLFAQSGAADCETIEKIFSPQLAENKDNLNWLKMVNRLLARADCEDAQLLYDVSESLHKIEPSSSSAYGLARMYMKSKDMDKVISFYKQAIQLEEDDEQKGTFWYQLGMVNYSKGNLVEARKNAHEAIKLRQNWGKPYILIGDLYAISAKSFGKDEFEHKTAYWAAVDQFRKAISVDPECATDAKGKISTYSKYFPGTEEIFFHNLKVGESYKIGGWIGVTTKVKAKK